jgi:hypothetical protein
MGLETVGLISGIVGAGMSTAGSIYNAASGGNSYNTNAAFPQVQQQYLQALTGAGGLGKYSMQAMADLTKTGGTNTSIGALMEALTAKQEQDRSKGTANILEQMGASGNRYGTAAVTGLGDFEAQLGENYGNILAQYVFNATESGLNRQLQASQIGVNAFSAPALTLEGSYSTPGAAVANAGANIGSIGTYLGSLGKSVSAAPSTKTPAKNYGFAAGSPYSV